MALDIETYGERAESFLEQIDREYFLQLSGRKPELEIEPIYARYEDLFDAGAVAALRDSAGAAGADEERRRRYLLAFAFDGHLGQATKREAEEVARLEATLELEVDGGSLPYRQAQIELAKEGDPDRRAAIEQARNAALAEHITPIHERALERMRELTRAQGWPSYASSQAELRGIDLAGLEQQTRAFLRATGAAYPRLIAPRLDAAGLPPLDQAARGDVPRLMRAPELDDCFPAEQLFESLERTVAGLGIDLGSQDNVHLDAEPRPTKSPRAFCSPLRVPGEVHLVFAPVGGREDYCALFHEGGHTEHYANTSAGLPFEFRYLGDNSVTESFAFLLEHVTESPVWLAEVLGVENAGEVLEHARASKLLFLRRYAAKLAYELELHGEDAALDAMPGRYAELLQSATRLRWPSEPWLDDVDSGFYVACYLRAWALEALWRRSLEDRFGARWFDEPDAGEWLRGLWAQGQRLNADELLESELGIELDFGVLAAEFAPAG